MFNLFLSGVTSPFGYSIIRFRPDRSLNTSSFPKDSPDSSFASRLTASSKDSPISIDPPIIAKRPLDAMVADRKSIETRKLSREGIHLSDEELSGVNSVLSEGIKKGQPLAHIFAVHEMEIPITKRTAYIYINDGLLDVRNIDLRRQTRYRKRRKKKSESGILNQKYRKGRTYLDFKALMENRSEKDVPDGHCQREKEPEKSPFDNDISKK